MSRFTIFGRPDCGYCVRSKQLLGNKALEFLWIDIKEQGISKADLEKNNWKTRGDRSSNFHGQNHIGGYTELEASLKEQQKQPEQEEVA